MSEWSVDKNGSMKSFKSFTLNRLRRDFSRGSKKDVLLDSDGIGMVQNSGSFVKRARLIRRKTTGKMTKLNTDDISVVSQVLVIRLKHFNDATKQETKFLNGSKSILVPYIFMSHPKIESGDKNHPPTLFFPDFTREVYFKPNDEQICQYTVILTNDKGLRKFAYCYKYFIYSDFDSSDSGFDSTYLRDPINYEVVVIISHFPVENTLRSMAYDMVKSLKRGHNTLEKLCSDLMHLTLTWNDRSIQHSQYLLLNNHGNIFSQTPITEFVKNVEKRILITGNDIVKITESVQSIIKLLSPLEWPHTLVPILPDTDIEFAYCPTPYIFGIMRYNLNKLKEIVCTSSDSLNYEDVIILDLKMGILKPLLQLNVVENHDTKKAVVIHAAKEMGYNSKIVEELFKLLKPIFVMKLKDDEFAQKFEKRIMIWYARQFGHFRSFTCGSSILSAKNRKKFIKVHPNSYSREFLEWFAESCIFQNFLSQNKDAKTINSSLPKFYQILDKYSPVIKGKRPKDKARTFFAKRFLFKERG